MSTKTSSILSGWTVKDLMRRDVTTVPSGLSVAALAERLQDEQITGAPVVDDGEVVGVVSQTDIVRLVSEHPPQASAERAIRTTHQDLPTASLGNGVSFFRHDSPAELLKGLAALALVPTNPLADKTVGDIMMPARFTVRPDTTLAGLAKYFLNAGIHRALVMDGDHLLGIVTTFDVLHAIAASDPSEDPA